MTDSQPPVVEGPARFRALMAREWRGILGREPDSLEVDAGGPTDEPRVRKTAHDLTGLALSGGGIRSATFNLGVLQELARLKLLGRFDYLSTVSGGGYVGGFLSRWLSRDPARQPDDLPHDGDDSAEVRHLREFSRFLAPRLGVTERETGLFVIAVLAAILPTLLVATSAVALGLWVFWGLAQVFSFEPWVSSLALGGLLFVTALLFEALESRQSKSEPGGRGTSWQVLFALLVSLGSTGLLYALLTSSYAVQWQAQVEGLLTSARDLSQIVSQMAAPGAIAIQGSLLSPENLTDDVLCKPLGMWTDLRAFYPALAVAGAVVGMIVLRFLLSNLLGRHGYQVRRSAMDRVLSFAVLAGSVWVAIALAWRFGSWVFGLTSLSGWALPGGATLTSALLTWLWQRTSTTSSTAKSGGLMEKLKPLLPQLLAYATLFLVVALLGQSIGWSLSEPFPGAHWYHAGGALFVCAVALVTLHPHEVGLHGAYRARIARAYLGDPTRHTEPCESDDANFEELRERPLHLVCCAANDLIGDPLANLGRGARSATLSRHGLTLGAGWIDWEEWDARLSGFGRLYPRGKPTLSSALTASAAAFNPNMGAKSVELGPAVTFLLCALDLRLGLWIPNPLRERSRLRTWIDSTAIGWLYFLELVGATRADARTSAVHLSDGGHFENLGLYELLRRHVRYIVVCDCGNDEEVAFDDLGNAIRKARQDLGIEIHVDLSALKGDEHGLARQHVVVGDIEYGKNDYGILVVIKPTLTGDEPGDVLQYKRRNQAFPHESTGDQFYDQAQWEAYRRLGEHAVGQAFACIERIPISNARIPVGSLFGTLRNEWYPTPADFQTAFLELTQRCYEIEDRVRAEAPFALVVEVYPELERATANNETMLTARDAQTVLQILLQVLQLMEDVWLGCKLDQQPNHPLNLGWLNYFHRWTNASIFRAWWPFLRPIVGPGVRRFLQERCNLPSRMPEGFELTFRQAGSWSFEQVEHYNSFRTWRALDSNCEPSAQSLFVLCLPLPFQRAEEEGLAVAHALVRIEGALARFTSDDLFVLRSLWGAGIGTFFLKRMLDHLRTLGVDRVEVTIGPRDEARLHDSIAATRQERADLLRFYQDSGFRVSVTLAGVLVWTPPEEASTPRA